MTNKKLMTAQNQYHIFYLEHKNTIKYKKINFKIINYYIFVDLFIEQFDFFF